MIVSIRSNDPEEIARITKSLDMALALWDLVYNSKKTLGWWISGQLEAGVVNPYDVLDEVYKRIYELMEEHNIDVDELIS